MAGIGLTLVLIGWLHFVARLANIGESTGGAGSTVSATLATSNSTSVEALSIRVNAKDGQRYVWIPPGSYTMGCSPGDGDCFDEEKPAHQVTISKGFWMGQTPVTVGAWKKYAKASNQAMPPVPELPGRELNPGWQNEQQPMVDITWTEAQNFCEAAGMRLPTEAEWEYAARAGTTGARYGDLDDVAWYADNSGSQSNGPHPVGMKQPNAWKLYDMLGNVWQWTSDWYGGKYYNQRDGSDPQGPPGGPFRTLRGGSWGYVNRNVRVSYRGWSEAGYRLYNVGVRCVGE